MYWAHPSHCKYHIANYGTLLGWNCQILEIHDNIWNTTTCHELQLPKNWMVDILVWWCLLTCTSRVQLQNLSPLINACDANTKVPLKKWALQHGIILVFTVDYNVQLFLKRITEWRHRKFIGHLDVYKLNLANLVLWCK